jgi:carboxymethylenebutenolidase
MAIADNFADTLMDEERAAQVSKRGKVGIVGYCWGGLLTWRAACTLTTVLTATSGAPTTPLRPSWRWCEPLRFLLLI